MKNISFDLYDVLEQIRSASAMLGDFIESEELDVEDLCQRLDEISEEIAETLD
jgi:hypothetical protein